MSIIDDINFFFKKTIEFDDLEEKISKTIQAIIENVDTDLFEEYFGKSAFENYLNPLAFQENLQKLNSKETPHVAIKAHMHKDLNTIFMQVCLYYACYKGCLPIIKYLLEQQHMPGDLDIEIREHFKHLISKDENIKGRTLCLAVRSKKLAVVKYLYEKTPAMIETTYGQPVEKTPLMIACEVGSEDITEYLIQNSANINAKQAASHSHTPLHLALKSKNANVIHLLVNGGAIVTTEEVNHAIKLGLDIKLINYLLLNCIEKENPYQPYLMTAIESGHVNNLSTLELNPNIVPFTEIAKFDDKPLNHRMLFSAVNSRNFMMLKYLQENKKINIKTLINEENQQRDKALMSIKNQSDRQRIKQAKNTLMYAAMESDSRKNDIAMLYYFFECLQAVPSPVVIKELCAFAHMLKTLAYLYSFLPEYHQQKETFTAIANDLELPLASLFKIYNSKFIQEGNIYEMDMDITEDYKKDIAAIIKEKLKKASSAELAGLDIEEQKGALFYFCTKDYDKNPSQLIDLITQLTSAKKITNVDVQNCSGESLAFYAAKCASFNIVRLLLMRKANADLPDNKGQTLLTKVLVFDVEKNFEWIKYYAKTITNSLRYASKEWLCDAKTLKKLLKLTNGDIQGIPMLELLENILSRNHGVKGKLLALFTHLSEKECCQMVQLLRDEAFIQKHNIDNYELSSYFEAFEKVPAAELSAESVKNRLKKIEKPSNVDTLAKIGTFSTPDLTGDEQTLRDNAPGKSL